MKNTCWKLFSYVAPDRDSAQVYLNEMARKGWALDETWLRPLLRFRRTQQQDLSYVLDWGDAGAQEDLDRLRLFDCAGWIYQGALGYWSLYASKPGASPAPIQESPEASYRRFRHEVLRRMAIRAGAAAALLLFFVLVLAAAPVDWEAAFWGSMRSAFSPFLLTLFLPLWLAGALGYLILLALRLKAWRAALRACEVPPRERTPKIWRGLSALFSLSLAVLLVFFYVDALFNDFFDWGVPVGTILGAGLLYMRKDAPAYAGKQAAAVLVMGVLFLGCQLLNGPVREVLPGRLGAAPVATSAVVDRGKYSKVARADSFLGSESSWWERGLDSEGQEEPFSLYRVEAWTWVTGSLAEKDLDATLERYGMETVPLKGREDVLTGRAPGRFLFFRGTTALQIIDYQYDGTIEELPILEDALNWLENG